MKSLYLVLFLTYFYQFAASASTTDFKNEPYTILLAFKYNETEAENKHLPLIDQLSEIANSKGWEVSVIKKTNQIPEWLEPHRFTLNDIADIVVNKLQGCKQYDNECKRIISNLNRVKNVGDITQELIKMQGGIGLPAQEMKYHIKINAGSNYRIQKTELNGNYLTKAIISAELFNLIRPLAESSNTFTGFTSFCIGGSCAHYELQIE